MTKVRRDKANIATGFSDIKQTNQWKGIMKHFMPKIRKCILNGFPEQFSICHEYHMLSIKDCAFKTQVDYHLLAN